MNRFITDKSLVERLREGDQNAVTDLFNAYWEPLFMASYSVLKNKEACEDIIQEIFIDIWRNRQNLVIKTSVKSYLYACVRYQVFKYIRKNKKIVRAELFEAIDEHFECVTPESELIHKELENHLDTIIDSLPAQCRKVYCLSRQEQLSHKEISVRLNISVKTVENHITKAHKTIRMSLGAILISE